MRANTEIAKIEAWLGARIPAEYYDFLLTHSEKIFGDQVYLYPADCVVERNQTYQTQIYCPGYITIGDDSGGRAFVIQVEGWNGAVFSVGHGCMDKDYLELVTSNFGEWVTADCPLPAEEEPLYSATERVHVYLERKPKSLKSIFLIKQQLIIETPISVLKALTEFPPCSLTDQLTYMQAIRRCAEVNAVDNCLGIRMVSDESTNLPLEWTK